MGGGAKRRPKNDNRNKRNDTPNNRGGRERSNGIRNSLFVEGGVLADWNQTTPLQGKNSNVNAKSGSNSKSKASSGSKTMPPKSYGNTFGFSYPAVELQGGSRNELVEGNGKDCDMDVSQPIVLVDSKETKIVAYFDETPPSKSNDAGFTYDYNTSFVLGDTSHKGLGFHDDSETAPDNIGSSSKQMEEEKDGSCYDSSFSDKDMDSNAAINHEAGEEKFEEVPTKVSSLKKNSGFVSIGGMKLFTHDISDEESDEDSPNDEGSESSESGESNELSESDESDNTSETDTDIDEEVAEDYLEGIGGSDNILDAKWLVGNHLDEYQLDDSDDDSSSSGGYFDEAVLKLGGIALQDASREYGMQKSQSRKIYSRGTRDAWQSPVDGLMLVKDPRTVSGKKKHVTRFPRSWPVEAQKSKHSRRYPGEKKKHRKETIASKRHERMLRRGVDLEKINMKLEQVVLDEVDMFSFYPMHSRDCSQVRRLASIYHLSSGLQGSGKKRFVTVTRTQHTSMPSTNDKIRLEKLIGAGDEDVDFIVNEGSTSKSASADKYRGNWFRKGSVLKSSKNSNNSISSSKRQGGRKILYADQPVSFVSSGIMSEVVEKMTMDSNETETPDNKVAISTSQVGAFELHTKGFGSKMMAKMGFVEGGGLGRAGQGMAEPIEVNQRPKSLGLGADIPDTGDSVDNKPESSGRREKNKKLQSIGTFEKHTKGFGSKMMARMGFVEGTGLGRNAQGIVNPLVAVRLPKSRGLGARG